MAGDFVECPQCAAKPGAPELCYSCLQNRELIDSHLQRVRQLQEANLRLAEKAAKGLTVAGIIQEREQGEGGPRFLPVRHKYYGKNGVLIIVGE